jgi:hypothetical protein
MHLVKLATIIGFIAVKFPTAQTPGALQISRLKQVVFSRLLIRARQSLNLIAQKLIEVGTYGLGRSACTFGGFFINSKS